MTAEPPLDIEISLVNTNNHDLLERCLASLPAACEALAWHVTVVDNASTDGSAELVEKQFPAAAVLRNEVRLGFSTNHNRVLASAVENRTARYLLILNEDTELRPGAVSELVRFCDELSEVGVAGPRLLLPDGQTQRSLLPLPTLRDEIVRAFRPRRRIAEPIVRGRLNGSCLLVRADALRQIGLLDERFFIFYEDTDLCRRLWDGGWHVALDERAIVVHHEHKTVSKPGNSMAMERQMLRSGYLYFCKHHGRGQARLAAAAFRLALVMRGAKALAEGLLGRDPTDRRRARTLMGLAGYDPREALVHEAEARRAEA